MNETTCWTLIDGAAKGEPQAREEFARRYESSVTAYLRARWAGNRALTELEDAKQDVFLECFRQGGALERLEKGRSGGFRAFLYGVVRNVALRVEERGAIRGRRQARLLTDLDVGAPDDGALQRTFDRAWAKARLREAAGRHEEWAKEQGEEEKRRVQILDVNGLERIDERRTELAVTVMD